MTWRMSAPHKKPQEIASDLILQWSGAGSCGLCREDHCGTFWKEVDLEQYIIDTIWSLLEQCSPFLEDSNLTLRARQLQLSLGKKQLHKHHGWHPLKSGKRIASLYELLCCYVIASVSCGGNCLSKWYEGCLCHIRKLKRSRVTWTFNGVELDYEDFTGKTTVAHCGRWTWSKKF